MAKTNSPYRYLEMQRRDILPSKLAPLLEVMFELNPEGMRETLKETASSTSETARAASLRCLGELRDRSSLELMKGGMADEFPEVRIAAAHGIGALGAREATPVLLNALKAGDLRVQNAARTALSSLWTELGQPPLSFPQDSGWQEFWKAKAADTPGAWDANAIEPLVPPGTVCLEH
jgi:HEAT repeat protein